MKKSTVLAIALMCGTSVFAQSKFSGPFAQIGLGYERSPASVGNETFDDGTGPARVVSDVKNSKGFSLPISAGYSFDISGDYSLAVGAEYTPTKRHFDVTAAFADGSYSFDPSTAIVKNRYAVYVAPSYNLNNDSQVYVKAGYAAGRFASNDGTSDSAHLHGHVLGLGYKTFISNNVYFYVEGDYTKISPAGINGSQGIGGTTYTYSYDVRGHTLSAVAGLGYKF